MRILKVGLIIILVLVVLFWVGLGLMYGFPWERIKAANTDKRYVIDKYGFTPTKVSPGFLLDMSSGVTISVKELDFTFTVGIGRRSTEMVEWDDYLWRRVEYMLEQALYETARDVLRDGERVVLGYVNAMNEGITPEDLRDRPESVIEKMQDHYSYYVMIARDFSGDGPVPDYERDYALFQSLTAKWKPSKFLVWYPTLKGQQFPLRLEVSCNDFDTIQSPDDLVERYEDPTWD